MEILLYKAKRNGSIFRTLRIDLKSGKRIEFSCAWSIQKGNWWGFNGEKKFFSIGKNSYDNGTVQYGIYIGRLALATLNNNNIHPIEP